MLKVCLKFRDQFRGIVLKFEYITRVDLKMFTSSFGLGKITKHRLNVTSDFDLINCIIVDQSAILIAC